MPQQDRMLADRRVRVVTLIDGLGPGGAEHLAVQIAARFDPSRIASTLVVSRWPRAGSPADASGGALDVLAAAEMPVIGLGRRHRHDDLRAWTGLARFLRHNRIDVLHAHKFGSNVWAAILGRAAGVPVVIAHEHSWATGGGLPRRLLDHHLISKRVDRFIAVSREDRRRMIEVEGIDPEITVHLPNAISRPVRSDDRDMRAELRISAEAPVIGAVATLKRVKALDVLVEAAAELTARYPDLAVLIVGSGPDQGKLEDLVSRLGLERNVRLLGRRTDVPDVLAACDAAVCCSDSEGCPMSVIEYMACGLPVVATSVGGLPDLVEPGVNGYLVPARDPHALAGALHRLLADPPSARAMGARAEERQRSELDLDVLIEQLEALYREVLASKRGEPDPRAAGQRTGAGAL